MSRLADILKPGISLEKKPGDILNIAIRNAATENLQLSIQMAFRKNWNNS